MNIIRPASALFLPLLLVNTLFAQDFQFQIDSGSSSSTVDNEIVLTLPSSVIGNYDASTNPGGTRTVPGLIGGSGNNVIPMDLVLTIDSLFSGPSSGSFGLDVDTSGLLVTIDGLNVDLLDGSTANADLVLSMLFDSFRTFQPTSIYVGGIPFDIPLGSSIVSDLFMVQNGSALPGVLVPTGNPGEYSFALSVPADLSFLIDFQGQQTPVGPSAIVLPLVGTLTVNGNLASVVLAIDVVNQQQIPDPAPNFAIVDQPMPLPTILPPGGTANLLLSATISQLDLDLVLDVDIVASGSLACGIESYCDSATNSTGFMANLVITGSLDVNDAQLDYDVSDLPPNRPGIFFMSQSTANLPGFGGSQGTLCVGAPQLRYVGVQFSDSAGTVAFSPDFANLPQGVVFLPGSVWYVQFWYRDSNPGATSNTTNGVRLGFCP